MGFIRIESVLAQNKIFVFEIKSEGVYDINCLSVAKHILSLDKIRQICITDCIILTLTEDRDLRYGFVPNIPFVKDQLSENTINAYDLEGNHLWNIGDIVGDIKMSFTAMAYISPETAEAKYNIESSDTSGILLECIAGGFVFVIDAVCKEVLYKASGKAR